LNKRGFTLIELLVASTVFLVSILVLAQFLNAGLKSVQTAYQLNNATLSMQSKAEEIGPYPFDSLSSLNGKSFAQGRGKITVIHVLNDLKSIDLSLDWDPKKIPIKFSILRSKY
jgi:prepilin-type N-terminal cleavage/methylation domain-containing protein